MNGLTLLRIILSIMKSSQAKEVHICNSIQPLCTLILQIFLQLHPHTFPDIECHLNNHVIIYSVSHVPNVYLPELQSRLYISLSSTSANTNKVLQVLLKSLLRLKSEDD